MIQLTNFSIEKYFRNGTYEIPKGNYFIPRAITLQKTPIIKGNGSTFYSKDISNVFIFNGRKNIKISNLVFVKIDSLNKNSSYAVCFINSQGIELEKVTTKGLGLINTELANVENQYLTTQNINVNNCSINGSNRQKGILLAYCTNWQISNCSITDCIEGIQWWGGDSDPNKKEWESNKRCLNGIIEKCQVSNIKNGGIWGSMGENILIQNCEVSNCNDVGIDFEGCSNSRAAYNKISNCKNGGLALFHRNNNIVLEHNIVKSTQKEHLVFGLYNSTTTRGTNTNISINNNQFISSDVDFNQFKELGSVTNARIDSNYFHNVIFIFDNQFNLSIKIESNNFHFSKADNNPVIRIGNTNEGSLVFQNNTIDYTSVRNLLTINNLPPPIQISQEIKYNDPNSRTQTYLSNNKIKLAKGKLNQVYSFRELGETRNVKHVILTDSPTAISSSNSNQIEIKNIKQ